MAKRDKAALAAQAVVDEANEIGLDEVVAVTPETAEAEPKAPRGRTYDHYLKTPTGEIYGPGYSVPDLLAKHPTEGATASGIRGISRQGRGTHHGWQIVDAEGNPIIQARAPRQPKLDAEGNPVKRSKKAKAAEEGDTYNEAEWAEHDAKVREAAQGLSGDEAEDTTATGGDGDDIETWDDDDDADGSDAEGWN